MSKYPSLSPYLIVTDAQESISFYQKAFGFVVDEIGKDDNGKIQHVSMFKQNTCIMFCPEGAFGMSKKSPINLNIEIPVTFYVYCDDVDELYKQAISHGAKGTMEPQEAFWGDRFCTVLDKDNYEWSFAKASTNVKTN